MTIERAACHVTCNMYIMQVLYSEHVYTCTHVIHVSTVVNVKLISQTIKNLVTTNYTCLHVLQHVCINTMHTEGFTDLLAGIVKRSHSSSALDIGITVSFIHQISDYIEMSLPGVKQYTISYILCLVDHSVFCESHEGHRGTQTDTLIRTKMYMYM